MDFRLLSKQLGLIALLIGATMVFSVPWAFPALGHREGIEATQFETAGAVALGVSILCCGVLGCGLLWLGRGTKGRLYRKEAMAIVGLSWVLATVLGALPFLLAGCYRSAGVRLSGEETAPQVYGFGGLRWRNWITKELLTEDEYRVLRVLLDAGGRGLSEAEFREQLDRDTLRQQVRRAVERTDADASVLESLIPTAFGDDAGQELAITRLVQQVMERNALQVRDETAELGFKIEI